jgi:hypothetical protein
MEIKNRQEQIELFSGSLQDSGGRQQNRHGSFFSFSFSLENIILLAIFCVMLVVLSFSLGVEKGKRSFVNKPVSAQIGVASIELKIPSSKIVVRPQIKNSAIVERQTKDLANGSARFTIQVASVEKNASFQYEVNKLKKIGYEAWIMPSGRYNRICVGKFTSESEASGHKKNLEKIFNGCIIRRI